MKPGQVQFVGYHRYLRGNSCPLAITGPVPVASAGNAKEQAHEGDITIRDANAVAPLDQLHFITFLTGPQDVPQYGTYEYNLKFPDSLKTPPKNPRWIDATNGEMSPQNIDHPRPTDVSVQWGPGNVVGAVQLVINLNSIWSIPVNIVQVTVADPVASAANPNARDFVVGTSGTRGVFNAPDKKLPTGETLKVISSDGIKYAGVIPNVRGENGITWYARVTLRGPNGDHGIDQITAGFIQNLTVVSYEGTWGTPATGPANGVTKAAQAAGILLEKRGQNVFWDSHPTADPKVGAYYSTKDSALLEKPVPADSTKEISSFDAPFATFPTEMGFPLTGASLDYTFALYIVAATSQAGAYVPESLANWEFNGSETLQNGNWVFDANAGISGAARGAWTAADRLTQPPVLTRRFNNIVDHLPYQWVTPASR